MNRGSGSLAVRLMDLNRASMRPRFMNWGSQNGVSADPFPSSGFNEAPIHESGKSGPGFPLYCLFAGFNEAPIHESGKWPPGTEDGRP